MLEFDQLGRQALLAADGLLVVLPSAPWASIESHLHCIMLSLLGLVLGLVGFLEVLEGLAETLLLVLTLCAISNSKS